MKFICELIVSFAVVFILGGCGNSIENVTNNKLYWGGYKEGENYLLKYDVFLLELEPSYLKLSKKYALSADGETLGAVARIYSAPFSVSQYLEGQDIPSDKFVKGSHYNVPVKVAGVVNKNTCIKVLSFIRQDVSNLFFGNLYVINVMAEICSGSYFGKIVNINDLSVPRLYKGNKFRYPNFQLLIKK